MCIMSVENNIEEKSTKNENALTNKKYSSQTIRLTLTLREPDEESCSVFNYNSLITEERRKRRREKDENQVNGSAEEVAESDEVKRLAQHFEEKYGGVNVKKRKKKRAPKFYNYTDLAAGYDESDSFIDNSEAFDEALPDDMETAFGGYYVNTGQLELKKVEIVEETSDPDEIRVGKRKLCALKSDDDSSSDDDGVPSDGNNEKTEDEDVESVNKKLPDETNHEEVELVEPAESRVAEPTKPITLEEKINTTIKINGNLIVKKKKKYKKRAADENLDEAPKQKKKAATVKSMLEEKRIVENGDSTTHESSKSAANTLTSINDVIESVVNAARNRCEDSRDSISSNSDTKSIDSRSSYDTEKGSHTDEPVPVESANVVSNNAKTNSSEPVKLPDNLDADVLELITQIKKCVLDSEASGARSLFKLYALNSKLLKMESQAKSLKTASRHALYEHLAYFFRCSKDTLMKRAKKLFIEEEEKYVAEPLQKLKASVDKAMPALMDSHTVAVQRVVEQKGVNDQKNGEIDDKKSIALKMPPKKFVWTEDTRRYLREAVLARLKCFHTLKLKKPSAEDYVKRFLETKVKCIWPLGWMETSILMKEGHSASSTPKTKKTSSVCNVNGSAAEVGSMPAAMSVPATTTVTSVKKQSESPVPSGVNNANAAVNYNLLANSLALPTLAIPHPTQTDASYSSAPSTGIPYRPDLSILNSMPPNQLSVDMMAQLALLAQRPLSTTPTPPTYSKSISPPKKSTTPTPPYSASRSTTPSGGPPVSTSSSSSYHDKKKSSDTSSSKISEMFKIESLINTNSKTKKEHHMLNHISQYNKLYSHKTGKKKTNSKKDVVQVPSKSAVNHAGSTNGCSVSGKTTSQSAAKSSNSGAVVSTELARKNRSRDVVLDLSPNKIKEVKCDKSDHQVHSGGEASPLPSSSVTAKDHNYWAGASAREEMKEEAIHEVQPPPKMSFSSPESNSPLSSSKTTHLSRKQRILQETARGLVQPTPDALPANLVTSSDSTSKRGESHSINNLIAAKFNDEKSTYDEKRSREETTTGTDFLSRIINDSLQTPLLYEHSKKDIELKSEERVISPADFVIRPSSRDSLSSVGSHSAERKTPNSETADIIQDLVALNQIGGHSIPRRMDYHDSKKHTEFSNGSMISQSSLHPSDKNKSSSLPRMSLSPFQNEFFKHIRKSTNESSSSYNTNSKSQDNCFTSELPSLEVDRSLLNRTNNASKQENLTAYNYQQSVIMPPASARWYIPESKS